MIMETRLTDLAPSFIPTPVSPAERLNGLQWQGDVRFNYSVSRIRLRANGVWQPWDTWQKIQPPVRIAMLWKKNGQWFAYDLRVEGQFESSTHQPTLGDNPLSSIAEQMSAIISVAGQALHQVAGATLTLDQLLAAMDQPTSCADVFSPSRGVSPSQQQALGPAVGGGTPSQPSLINPDGTIKFKQVTHGPAADGFKFLYTLPLSQREYRGAVDGFVTALPGFFERASATAGMTGRDFSKEIAFIIDAVKTCGQITPQMAASVFEPNGKKVWGKVDGVEHLEKLGPQYQVCEVKNGLPVPPQVTGVRGLGLRIEPWGNSRTQWQESKGFIVQVLFGQMTGDDRDMRGQRLQPTVDYTVIHAIFDRH